MKITITAVAFVLLIVLTTTCFFESKAAAERFTGSGMLGGSTISITGFGSLGFIPTWTFDFETTGQSVLFHQLDMIFNGIVSIPDHSQVFIDLTVESSLAGLTLDINPVVGTERWQTESYTIPNLRIAGTYHSFDFENSFDVTVQPANPMFENFETQLGFTNYPNSIDIGRISGNDSVRYQNPNVELEPLFFITGLDLDMDHALVITANAVALVSCPCCDCGDFNEDGSTDGLDFLALQRGFGTSPATISDGDGNGDETVDDIDLGIWQSQYGDVAPLSATSAAVPEPTTSALALAALCLVMGRRRSR